MIWSSTPFFTNRKAIVLSLYVAYRPIAPYIGQAHYIWQNNYKQVNGSNSEICGKVCFPKMNIISND